MSAIDESVPSKFATIAVLDLETCNLPMHNNNKTGITELCIYGFAAKLLEAELETAVKTCDDESVNSGSNEPAMPRVQHKLTLLFNPNMMVHPQAEQITGLNNYILEQESTFDKNAAETVLGFLQHLQQPVCLVAHNGWDFDFPIIKKSFEKLEKNLPENMVCVDSLRAFLEIDKKVRIAILEQTAKNSNSTTELLEDPLSENSQFNWRQFNETTPNRPPTSTATKAAKRKLLSECNAYLRASDDDNELPLKVSLCQTNTTLDKKPTDFKSRRQLYFGEDASPAYKKYPPRGVYKLESLYRRTFSNAQSIDAHHAEADVQMLVKLILHYGEDFLAYAEQHAKPLSEVPPLGRYK